MPHSIVAAAVQLDVAAGSTAYKLSRARYFVAEAAEKGARLVVLPELFNTGYSYTPENYFRAEPVDGYTVRWMKQMAAEFNIHLAGSLLLLDQGEIYNALLLVAPDGRLWRYDKHYPWGWERAYFRPGRSVTVAQTDLGAIGLLICWDAGHLDLWQAYAGQVDCMVVASCPPDMTNPTYLFPDGNQITIDQMGPLMARMKGTGELVFQRMIAQQTAWLGVPTVATVSCGQFLSPVPSPRASFLSVLPAAPWLIKYYRQAPEMRVACEMVEGTWILNAAGQPSAQLSNHSGENYCLAEIELNRRNQPRTPQPTSPLAPLAYVLADRMLPALVKGTYQRGLQLLQT